MRRPATKRSTRAASSEEKRFLLWVKHQPCIECGNEPVIVEHMYGSAMINNKVLIGHWAILPLCVACDSVKTNGSHNAYRDTFGRSQADAWHELVMASNNKPLQYSIPAEVYQSIADWGK